MDDGWLSKSSCAQVLTFVPWEGRGGSSSKTLSRKSSKGRKSKGKGEVGEKKEEKRRKRRRQKRKRGKKGGERDKLWCILMKRVMLLVMVMKGVMVMKRVMVLVKGDGDAEDAVSDFENRDNAMSRI